LSFGIFLFATLLACQKPWTGSYEVQDYQCFAPSYDNVLFLYPNFIEYSVLDAMQYSFPDEPGVVFKYLSQIDRFAYWHHADEDKDDVLYLAGTCGPLAVVYEGESFDMPGWHRYSIRLSELVYYELRQGAQGFIVKIPFPIHLFDKANRRMTVVLNETDNLVSADYEAVEDFALQSGTGVIDSGERTITYSYPVYHLVLKIVDQGNGTIRVIKGETTS
jgi:hypothetical protein